MKQYLFFFMLFPKRRSLLGSNRYPRQNSVVAPVEMNIAGDDIAGAENGSVYFLVSCADDFGYVIRTGMAGNDAGVVEFMAVKFLSVDKRFPVAEV